MSNPPLHREVIKWLQGLELSFYPKNPRRDFSNGYLIAEIFSHYYPRDFSMHSFHKAVSLSAKQHNWSQILKFFQKHNLNIKKETVDGTLYCKPGAAELLLQDIYSILTNQSVAAVQHQQADFTDQQYQQLLPSLARSTASTAIRNNLTATETMAEPDESTNQRKARIIVRRHLEQRAADRGLLAGRSTSGRASISFKEIKVNQPVRCSLLNHRELNR